MSDDEAAGVTVLVTGDAGFIGFHVARALLERGDAVVGFDILNDYYDPRLKAARLAELHRSPRSRSSSRPPRRPGDRAAVEAALPSTARRDHPPRRPGRGALLPG